MLHLPKCYHYKICYTTQWEIFSMRKFAIQIKTSASIFQAITNTIIEEMNLLDFFCYQNDVRICSNLFQDTLVKLAKFLKIFQKYNLTLNYKKCTFYQTLVNCLVFSIKYNRIYPVTSNILKNQLFSVPKSKWQVKGFLGLSGF